jgi:hypothetical protein
METYSLIDKKKGDHPFAFGIGNAYVGLKMIANLLMQAEGVTDVRPRKPFSRSSEVHVEFKYLGQDYIVWEPYGDNSRYWIGPKDADRVSNDISSLESAFKRYRPPFLRQAIANILTLKFFRPRKAG